jgi:two-component system, response regulator RegA
MGPRRAADGPREGKIVVADPARSSVKLANALTAAGYHTWLADELSSAYCAVSTVQPQWILLDPFLQSDVGLGLIRELLALAPQARIVVITSWASVSMAFEALRLGAADFLCKPVASAQVLRLIRGQAERHPGDWMSVEDAAADYIMETFEQTGSLSATARVLGLDRRSLRRMVMRFERQGTVFDGKEATVDRAVDQGAGEPSNQLPATVMANTG